MLIKLGQNIVKCALIAWKSVENVRFKKKKKRKIMKRKIMLKNNEEIIASIYYNFFEQGKACWLLKKMSYKNVKRIARGQ